MGQEGLKVVLIGHIGQFAQEILEVGVWIDTKTLTAKQQRVNHSGSFSGLGVADKEPVFFAQGGGSHGVLDQVVRRPVLRGCLLGTRGSYIPTSPIGFGATGQSTERPWYVLSS